MPYSRCSIYFLMAGWMGKEEVQVSDLLDQERSAHTTCYLHMKLRIDRIENSGSAVIGLHAQSKYFRQAR